jgi:hypothetical protein
MWPDPEAAQTWRFESFVSGALVRAVPICARIELEIAQLDGADAKAFMDDLDFRGSGLDRVICASYDLLGLSRSSPSVNNNAGLVDSARHVGRARRGRDYSDMPPVTDRLEGCRSVEGMSGDVLSALSKVS